MGARSGPSRAWRLGSFSPAGADSSRDQQRRHERHSASDSECDNRRAHKHGLIQATEETPAAMRDAISLAIDKVEKQAQRARKRFMDRRRRADRTKENGNHWPLLVVEPRSPRAGSPRVILTDRLEVKPMAIEDAALEMENSGHGFVVFRDTRSDRLSVLYRRADSNYGLISPDV